MLFGSRMYTVNDIVQRTGITRKTLFYYDHIDLLKPDAREGVQERKMYTEESYRKLLKILEYRDAGLHINEIKQVLDMNRRERRKFLQSVIERMEKENEDNRKNIRRVQNLIDN